MPIVRESANSNSQFKLFQIPNKTKKEFETRTTGLVYGNII